MGRLDVCKSLRDTLTFSELITNPSSVLMSFESALRDIELLYDLAISVIIVDEVHRVKNPRAKSTIAFHRFECTVRFGLTGTGT